MITNNLEKYRKAKHYVSQLSEILNILNDSVEKLQIYKNFLPVTEVIETTQQNIGLINAHLNHQQKILDSKGTEPHET